MKRLFLLFFSALLCTAVSAHDFEVDGIYYNITSSTDMTVSVVGSSCSGAVVIPEKVAYDSKEYSVTSIGDWAFYSCSGMTSVTIPNSVTSIGGDAFWKCSGLTAVYITDLYAWCKIKFSGNASNPTFYAHHLYLNGKEITNLVILDDVTSINSYAFEGCSGLTSVTIPNSVTSIGSGAFYNCSGLTSVTIPNSVTSIGTSAFSGCSGLTTVTIPNSVTSIGSSAFSGCSGMTAVHITDLSAWCKVKFDNYESNPTRCAHHLYLNGEEITNLVIPDDIISIGNYAFYGCSGLTSVTIGNSVTSIGNCLFMYCSGLTSVIIGKSITDIGEQAFYSCSGIKSIHITDLSAWFKIKFANETANPMYSSNKEVTYVNDMELTDLTIPDFITDISYTFSGCGSLRRLTIPESCKTVPKYAFRNCNNLQELTLPSTCVACYDYSFNGSTSLKKINCQAETPPTVYANTFSSSIYTRATLKVPEAYVDKYKAANIWKDFKTIRHIGYVEVESITFDKTTYELEEGDTMKLAVTVSQRAQQTRLSHGKVQTKL